MHDKIFRFSLLVVLVLIVALIWKQPIPIESKEAFMLILGAFLALINPATKE
jgi:hypothetical protein